VVLGSHLPKQRVFSVHPLQQLLQAVGVSLAHLLLLPNHQVDLDVDLLFLVDSHLANLQVCFQVVN
jgi:hypothetical protein